jgi:hypothetical protein
VGEYGRLDKLILSLRAASNFLSEGRTLPGLGVYNEVLWYTYSWNRFSPGCVTSESAFHRSMQHSVVAGRMVREIQFTKHRVVDSGKSQGGQHLNLLHFSWSETVSSPAGCGKKHSV